MLLAGILVPAGLAQAAVKTGVYYQVPSKKNPAYAYIGTKGGKVNGAVVLTKFKDNKGATCSPTGYTEVTQGYYQLSFAAKHNATPKSSGKFSITNKKAPLNPGLHATVKGKFVSSNKARFKAVLKIGSCTAKFTATRAIYTAGG